GSTIGGSIAVNQIRNTVEAGIVGMTVDSTTTSSDVRARTGVAVTARDEALLATMAGNIAASFGGGKFGVGAAIAVNNIQDTVHASIDNAAVSASEGDITVQAEFAKPDILPSALDAQIYAVAVSGGGADSVAGAGSVALNFI